MKRAAKILGSAVWWTMLTALPCHPQGIPQIYLGPESVRTIELTSPEVLYRIGEPEGPGMLDQGEALAMAPDPAGGFLMYTAYFSDGPIQHYRDGKLQRAFGRRGDGPGEYQQINALSVDPRTGHYWASDRTRMVSFTPEGEPDQILWKSHAGQWAQESLFLPDGSLLLVGPGGTMENLGFLLHRYDFDDGTWSSHYPLFRDSVFMPMRDIRKWVRKLALLPDGRVLSITDQYVIEVFDPTRDSVLEGTILRRPDSWPEDVAADYAARSEKHRLARPFMVTDAWVDPQGRLWVASVMPEENWEQDIGDDPRRPGQQTFLSTDGGFDSLIEVIDPSTWTVLASYQLDPLIRYIVGPGMLAYYAGDLPYPQINVIKVSLDQER